MAAIDVPKASINNLDNFKSLPAWDGERYNKTGLTIGAHGNYSYSWNPTSEIVKIWKPGTTAELVVTDGKVVGVSWTLTGPAGAQKRTLANQARWVFSDTSSITQAKTRAIVEGVLADIATVISANNAAPGAVTENAAAVDTAL